MSPFHVNYQKRLVSVAEALEAARRDDRADDAVALELAMRVLHLHVSELEQRTALATV
jgi:hypothetical protein